MFKPRTQQDGTEQDSNSKDRKAMQRSRGLRWLVAGVAVCSLLALAYCWQWASVQRIQEAVTWLQLQTPTSIAVFMGASAALSMALIPGSLLQLIAGGVYGGWRGLAISYPGTMGGQILAFFLGRYLLKEQLAVWIVRRFPTWPTIEKALFLQGGIKMVTLLRLAPVIPDSVTSYGLAITRVSPWTFSICTAVASLPYAMLYCYLGSTSTDIAQICFPPANPGLYHDVARQKEGGVRGVVWAVIQMAALIFPLLLTELQTIAGGGGHSEGDSTSSPAIQALLACASVAVFALMVVYVGFTLKRALAEAASAQPQQLSATGMTTDEEAAHKEPLLLNSNLV